MMNSRRQDFFRSGKGVACLAAAFMLVAGSLYGFARHFNLGDVDLSWQAHAQGATCSAARETAKRLLPLAKGEVAALTVRETPKPLIELSFNNVDEKPTTLSAFRGKVVLLNLWATWCVPCRKEMPALDQLQGELGSDKFEVLAINIDTRNLEKPKAFLDEIKVNRLAYHADPQAKVFFELKKVGKAFGMPTTILIDAEGCELANLAGPAEWASEDAKSLIRAALTP